MFPWLKQAAAADVDDDSTMVAIYPPKGWVDLLAAHTHPSQRDKLHATLVYLGKTTPEQAQQALSIVQGVVTKHAPIKMTCNGVGIFDNPDAVVRVINPNGVGLTELRAAIYNALNKAKLVTTKTHGFLPHMTLEYHEDRRLPENWERVAKLPFGRWTVKDVRVVRGDKEIGRAALTGTKEATMTPYQAGYTRTMKIAGLTQSVLNPEQGRIMAAMQQGGLAGGLLNDPSATIDAAMRSLKGQESDYDMQMSGMGTAGGLGFGGMVASDLARRGRMPREMGNALAEGVLKADPGPGFLGDVAEGAKGLWRGKGTLGRAGLLAGGLGAAGLSALHGASLGKGIGERLGE